MRRWTPRRILGALLALSLSLGMSGYAAAAALPSAGAAVAPVSMSLAAMTSCAGCADRQSHKAMTAHGSCFAACVGQLAVLPGELLVDVLDRPAHYALPTLFHPGQPMRPDPGPPRAVSRS